VLGATGTAVSTAHGDRREASLHGHVIAGIARTTDDAAGDGRAVAATAPLAGLAIRASRAPDGTLGNHLQYDAALALLATGGAAFPDGHFTPIGRPAVDGPYTLTTQAVRLDAGATLRLGVAWIPTVRLAAGVQARRRGPPQVMSITGEVIPGGADYTADLIAGAAVGLDHRPHRRVVVGAALGGTIVLGRSPGDDFRTLELSVHASYYWYPDS
jgi:hypothetical protein